MTTSAHNHTGSSIELASPTATAGDSAPPAGTAPPRPSVSRRIAWLILVGLTIFAGFLRFAWIDKPTCWNDEAHVYRRLTGSFGELVAHLRNDGFGPLHYEMYWAIGHWGKPANPKQPAMTLNRALWGMVQFHSLPGESTPSLHTHWDDDNFWAGNPASITPFWMRFIPSLAGTLMVPAIYFLARQFCSRRTSLFAAAFAACSAYLMVYAHDGKMYMHLWFFVTLNIACLLWWCRTGLRFAWLCWIATGLAMAGLHAPGMMMLLLEPIFLLFQKFGDWRTALKRWALLLFGLVVIGSGPGFHYLGFNRWTERLEEEGWSAAGLGWMPPVLYGRDPGNMGMFVASAYLYSWEWPGTTYDDEKQPVLPAAIEPPAGVSDKDTYRAKASSRIMGQAMGAMLQGFRIDPRVASGLMCAVVIILGLAVLGMFPWTRRFRGERPDDAPTQPWWRTTLCLGIWLCLPAYAFYSISQSVPAMGLAGGKPAGVRYVPWYGTLRTYDADGKLQREEKTAPHYPAIRLAPEHFTPKGAIDAMAVIRSLKKQYEARYATGDVAALDAILNDGKPADVVAPTPAPDRGRGDGGPGRFGRRAGEDPPIVIKARAAFLFRNLTNAKAEPAHVGEWIDANGLVLRPACAKPQDWLDSTKDGFQSLYKNVRANDPAWAKEHGVVWEARSNILSQPSRQVAWNQVPEKAQATFAKLAPERVAKNVRQFTRGNSNWFLAEMPAKYRLAGRYEPAQWLLVNVQGQVLQEPPLISFRAIFLDHWFLVTAILVPLAGLLAAWRYLPAWVRLLLAQVAVVAAAAMLLWPMIPWTAAQRWWTFADGWKIPRALGEKWQWILADPRTLLAIVVLGLPLTLYFCGQTFLQRLLRIAQFAAVAGLLWGTCFLVLQINLRMGPIDDGPVWMPRYVGIIWPAFAIALCALLMRLPTPLLRWTAICLLLGVNLTQAWGRMFWGSEPRVDLMARDLVAGDSYSSPVRSYFESPEAPSTAHPAGGTIYNRPGKYFVSVETQYIPPSFRPPTFLGAVTTQALKTGQIHVYTGDADVAYQARSPGVQKIIVWDRMLQLPAGNHPDALANTLGPGWKKPGVDEFYPVRYHWNWSNLYISRRREYVRDPKYVAPVIKPPVTPVTPPVVPVTPPATRPAIVTPPVAPPVTPPATRPLTPPIAPPIAPPVALPATRPAPVPPVAPPVAPPTTRPAVVAPPLAPPVAPPAPVVPPVTRPVAVAPPAVAPVIPPAPRPAPLAPATRATVVPTVLPLAPMRPARRPVNSRSVTTLIWKPL